LIIIKSTLVINAATTTLAGLEFPRTAGGYGRVGISSFRRVILLAKNTVAEGRGFRVFGLQVLADLSSF
jgi:hypothetical protein